MPLWGRAFLIGAAFSLPWGIAEWLKWQQMKARTIVPAGSVPVRHGTAMGWVINALCVGCAPFLLVRLGWWTVLTAVITSFAGGWVATLMERVLYCSRERMDTFVFAASEYAKEFGSDEAVRLMSDVAPKWWIKLMPRSWQKELAARLTPILLPRDGASGPQSI